MAQDFKYSIRISPLTEDDGGGYLVEVPELPGCVTDGDSVQEAVEKIPDAIESWIKAAKELGRTIPTPKMYSHSDEVSGKLTLRMPKSLHRELVQVAESEGISLNQLIIYYLGKGIGQDFGLQRKISSHKKQSSISQHISFYYQQYFQQYFQKDQVGFPRLIFSNENSNFERYGKPIFKGGISFDESQEKDSN